MARYLPVCDGVLTNRGAGGLSCTGGAGWVSVDASYFPGQFSPSQIDPAICAQNFSIGFGLVGGVILLSRGFSIILEFIRSV